MTLEELIAKRSNGLFKIAGFDADDVAVLATRQSASDYCDDLDDIFCDMGVDAFDDEEWNNETHRILAVGGAGEAGEIVQAQVFFIHASETGKVHVLELAPTTATSFAELPVYAESLAVFDSKIS